MTDKAELLTDEKKPESRGGSSVAFSVEARCAFPRACGNQIFTKEWARVSFVNGLHGVPSQYDISPEFSWFNVYPYSTAQALRWWFMAAFPNSGTETRLVEHRVSFEAKCIEVKPIDELCPYMDQRKKTA